MRQKSKSHSPAIVGALFYALLTLGVCDIALAQQAPTAAQADHDRRLGWFRDARFGMFIHWGLYAVPGGIWQGTAVPGAGEWILQTGKIDPLEYMKLQQQFNPVEFNADEWVRIAKLAGQKYIVITSKHHDGFGLWDSKQTQFDAMGSPFKRDILLELAGACQRAGIQLCFYHSIMDWTHPEYTPHRPWDSRKDEDADFRRYIGYMKEQLRELISGKYGKIGILWFDGEWESTWTHEMGVDLARFVRSIDPDIIINNRVDKGRSGMAGLDAQGDWAGDYGTPEQEIPSTGIPGSDWETCMTMNDTWGWKSEDHHWKSAPEMIRMLCDIASKGGNFLLNVGPQPDGKIPQASVDRLMRIGQWMETNGDSIYGTSSSPFVRLPWGRCTQKKLPDGTRLYLQVFDWPAAAAGGENWLEIPGLLNEIRAVRLLGATEFASTSIRTPDGWKVSLPATAPDEVASVIAIDIVGEPQVEPWAIKPRVDGSFELLAKDAALTGHVQYESKCDNLGYWTDEKATASWRIRSPIGARYRVLAKVAAPASEEGSRYKLSVGDDPTNWVEGTVTKTADWCDFQTVDLGLVIVSPGDQTVSVVPQRLAHSALMNLRSISLVPQAGQ